LTVARTPRVSAFDTSAAVPVTDRITVPKASQLIAGELRRQIVRGGLAPGSALPPEAELMERFGVSRPTLREAYRILESERLITMIRGARGGARAEAPDLAVGAGYTALLLQVRGTTLEDVYEARKTIEPPAARSFAERRRPDDLERLRACLADEEAAIGTAAAGRAFAQFHQVVVDGSGSSTLSVLAGLLVTIVVRHHEAEIGSKRSSPEQRADNERGYRAHRRLAALIESGEGAEAETFWRRHMDRAGELLLQDLGRTTVVDLLG
jgi:DNA-binding FadR family transcriptional regulator